MQENSSHAKTAHRDSWGEVAPAQVRSPQKPTPSPHRGVLEGGSQCLEHHAAKANTNVSGNREKEDWEKDDCGGVSALWDATAPADAHALSSGMLSSCKHTHQHTHMHAFIEMDRHMCGYGLVCCV